MSTNNTPTPTELRLAREAVGNDGQWREVARNLGGNDYRARQAAAAVRNARLCGTDPSWYGF